MTDDKAIEAALDAWFGGNWWREEEGMIVSYKSDMRAAIIAYEIEVARLFWRPLPENMREQG